MHQMHPGYDDGAAPDNVGDDTQVDVRRQLNVRDRRVSSYSRRWTLLPDVPSAFHPEGGLWLQTWPFYGASQIVPGVPQQGCASTSVQYNLLCRGHKFPACPTDGKTTLNYD